MRVLLALFAEVYTCPPTLLLSISHAASPCCFYRGRRHRHSEREAIFLPQTNILPQLSLAQDGVGDPIMSSSCREHTVTLNDYSCAGLFLRSMILLLRLYRHASHLRSL